MTGVILGLSVVLAGVPGESATADDAIDLDPATQTLEYGSSFYINVVDSTPASGTCMGCIYGAQFEVTGPISATIPSTTFGYHGVSSWQIAPDRFLPVGDYVIGFTYSESYGESGQIAEPARVTVTPAELGTDLRITADQNDPGTAIVSVALTGGYVQNLAYPFPDPIATLPAGTWHVEVSGPDGDSAFSADLPQPAGGPPFISLLWADVSPQTDYTATARFEMDAAMAGNFETTTATDVSFRSPAAAAPTDDEPEPGAEVPEPAADIVDGLPLPLWVLIFAGALLVAEGALLVVLIVRMRRLARPIGTAVTEVAL
jgi:hypothetical protein